MASGVYLDTQDCRNCKDLGRRVNDLRNLLEKSEEIYSAMSTENGHLKEFSESYRISERNLRERFLQLEERENAILQLEESLNKQYTSLHEEKTEAIQELINFKQLVSVSKSENESLVAQNAQIHSDLAKKYIDGKLLNKMRLYLGQKQFELICSSFTLKEMELEKDKYIHYIEDLKAQLDEKEKQYKDLINYQNFTSLNQESLESSGNLDSSNTVSSSVLGEQCMLERELDDYVGDNTLGRENVSLQTSVLLMDSSTQTAECLCTRCQVLGEESRQHTFFSTTLHVSSVNEMNGSNIDNSTQTEDLPDSQHKSLYSSSSSDLPVSGTRPSGQEDRSRESEGKSVLSNKSFETEACAQESDGDPGSENSAVELHQVLPSPWSPSDGTVSLCNSPRSDKYAKCRYNSSSWNLKLITSSLLAFFTVILLMWMYLKMDAECRKSKESVSCIFRHVNQIFAVRFTYPQGPPPV